MVVSSHAPGTEAGVPEQLKKLCQHTPPSWAAQSLSTRPFEPPRSRSFPRMDLREDGNDHVLHHTDWCRGVSGVGWGPVLHEVSPVEPAVEGALLQRGRGWGTVFKQCHASLASHLVSLSSILFVYWSLASLFLCFRSFFSSLTLFLSPCINALFLGWDSVLALWFPRARIEPDLG